MKLSQEDIGAQVAEIARENDMTPQAALQAMKKAGSLGELEFRAMFQKVMAFLTEKAHLSKLPAGGAQ
jgi:hypothetical protein